MEGGVFIPSAAADHQVQLFGRWEYSVLSKLRNLHYVAGFSSNYIVFDTTKGLHQVLTTKTLGYTQNTTAWAHRCECNLCGTKSSPVIPIYGKSFKIEPKLFKKADLESVGPALHTDPGGDEISH